MEQRFNELYEDRHKYEKTKAKWEYPHIFIT